MVKNIFNTVKTFRANSVFDVTDEAVINESNCIEQIYTRFQAFSD